MRRFLSVYPTLLRVGMAEALAYRAEFLVWMLSMTLPLVMLALWSAVAREAPVGRFDSAAFVAYYLATLIVRQLGSAWVVWELTREIREGTLGLKLLRPVHPLLAYSAESLAALPLRAVISVPLALLLLFTSGQDQVTRDPVLILCFLASLGGAWLLSFVVSAAIGTLGLYIESALSLWQVWMGAFAVLSGYLVPLELFPPAVERVARALPLAYMQAFPVEVLIGLRGRAEALSGLAIQWTWAVGALVLLLWFWKRAVRRFGAFGG